MEPEKDSLPDPGDAAAEAGNKPYVEKASLPPTAEESALPLPSASDFEETIRKLEAEKQQLKDQLLRKQAEFENLRKRLSREKEEFLQYSLFDTVKSFLPILDGFELALESDGGSEEYRKGVELIYQQLRNTLQKLGLEVMEAKGREFDPHLHEAIATVVTDQHAEHQILEEVQRGYLFKQRVLRPAWVKVAKHPVAKDNPSQSDVEPE
ncbi:MAG: nucleotide exchange factor GrpE [Acidobacteria bacterium]|nr:nucleotide exchange factor GrpE [Acidobacteriota bacterium]